MADTDVPQYADVELEFEEISYSDGDTIDLSAVDDIILSISKSSVRAVPFLVVKYTVSPSKFTIDNTAKNVKVRLTGDEMGNEAAKFYVNLWIIDGTTRTTHYTKNFDVVATVKYDQE